MSATVIVDGQKLRKLRESHSLSQEGLEFACSKKKGCSVSVATIKRAELGHPLSRRTVARLAQFFSVPIDALLLEQPSVSAFELSFVSDRQPCLLIWVQCTPRAFCQRVQGVLSRFMPVFTQSSGNTLVCAIPYVKGKRQYLALLSCVSDLLEVAHAQSATLTVLVQMETVVSLGLHQWVLQDAVFDTLSQSAAMVPVGSLAVSEELVMLSHQYFEFNTEPKASRFYVLKHRFPLGRPPYKTVGRESEFLHWGHAVGAIEQSKQATVFSVSGLEGCGKTHVLQYFQHHDRVKRWRQVVVDLEMHQPASAVMIEVLRPALNELGLLGGAVILDEPVLVILDNLHLVDSQGFSNLIDLIQETRKQPVLWLVAWAPTQQASSMLDELRCTGLKNTQLSLEPLQLHQLRALAMNEQLLSDEFLQAVYVHSAGNPYFFQELVKLAVDGVSVLKPAFQYSFDALNDDEKAVLALLSCSLHNLTVDDVLAFPSVTSETIHSLRALNWVRVSFRNTVSFVLDEAKLVVQRSVSAAVRVQVYDWLASLMDVASNQDETMLWLKGEYNLGASHHMAAARSFFAYGQVWVRQYSYQQAIHWLNRSLDALALTEPNEESHLLMSDIRLSLARINSISRGWVSQSSMLAYQQCMNLSERHHCTLRHCVALVGVWVTQLMALDFRTSEKTAYDMLEQAQQGNEPFAVSLAHSCLSNTHFWLGQHDKAIEHAEQACLCYQDCKDAHLAEGIGFNPLGLACCFGALSASVMCNYQQMAFFRQYHSIDVISKSPFNQAIVIQGDIWCFYHQRDPEQVLLLAHDLVALSEKHNFPFYKGVAMLFLGWAQAVLHPEQAADQLQVVEEGYNYWLASSGDQIAHSLYALIKAEVFRVVGQRRQASDILQHALDFALQKEEVCYLAPLYARLGQLDKSRQVALAQGASLFLQPEWCVSSVFI